MPLKPREASKEFLDWAEGKNGVGEFIIMRSHTGSIGIGIKTVSKVWELPQDVIDLCMKIVSMVGSKRVNIICDLDGKLDRIESYQMKG